MTIKKSETIYMSHAYVFDKVETAAFNVSNERLVTMRCGNWFLSDAIIVYGENDSGLWRVLTGGIMTEDDVHVRWFYNGGLYNGGLYWFFLCNCCFVLFYLIHHDKSTVVACHQHYMWFTVCWTRIWRHCVGPFIFYCRG